MSTFVPVVPWSIARTQSSAIAPPTRADKNVAQAQKDFTVARDFTIARQRRLSTPCARLYHLPALNHAVTHPLDQELSVFDHGLAPFFTELARFPSTKALMASELYATLR